jgi:hypothetical protein
VKLIYSAVLILKYTQVSDAECGYIFQWFMTAPVVFVQLDDERAGGRGPAIYDTYRYSNKLQTPGMSGDLHVALCDCTERGRIQTAETKGKQ